MIFVVALVGIVHLFPAMVEHVASAPEREAMPLIRDQELGSSEIQRFVGTIVDGPECLPGSNTFAMVSIVREGDDASLLSTRVGATVNLYEDSFEAGQKVLVTGLFVYNNPLSCYRLARVAEKLPLDYEDQLVKVDDWKTE